MRNAMATTVSVLWKGRWHQLQTSPNDKLASVLEKVCGVDVSIRSCLDMISQSHTEIFVCFPLRQICMKINEPVAGHTLTFQNKKVDLSLSLRFANIPNNAKLELVAQASGAKPANVQIVLQLPDGQRLQLTSINSSNFWTVLKTISPGHDWTRQWYVIRHGCAVSQVSANRCTMQTSDK